MLWIVYASAEIMLALTAIPFLIDAYTGMIILKTVFSKSLQQREADLIE